MRDMLRVLQGLLQEGFIPGGRATSRQVDAVLPYLLICEQTQQKMQETKKLHQRTAETMRLAKQQLQW